MNSSSYLFQVPESLSSTLREIDAAIAQIKRLQKDKPTMWSAIQQKLRAEWTFDSNAIVSIIPSLLQVWRITI